MFDYSSDTIPPVIVTDAIGQTAVCNNTSISSLQDWYNNAGGAVATDNSGIVSLVANLTLAETEAAFIASMANFCGNKGAVDLYWIAVDGCNNESVDTTFATFLTVDNTDPVFILEADNENVNCNPAAATSLENWLNDFGGSQAEDSCSDMVTYTRIIWTDSQGNSGAENYPIVNGIPILTNVCNWSVLVSFFVRDDCGNETPTTARFSVFDTQAPGFSSLPSNVTISCDELTSLDSIWGIDACMGFITADLVLSSTQSLDDTSCGHYNYVLDRSWTVTDVCGNSDAHVQKVTVQDITPPSFDIQDTIYISCEAFANSNVNFGPTNITDNCSGVSMSFNDVTVGTGCNYTVDRSWTATDICLNDRTLLQVIIVTDDQPPVISVAPESIGFSCDDVVNLELALQDWINNRANAVASDSCNTMNSFVAIPGSYDLNDPSTYPGTPLGSLAYTGCPSSNGFLFSLDADFVFYDACNNATFSQASFGLIDTVPPDVSNCQPTINLVADGVNCEANVSLMMPTVFDNCSEMSSPVVRQVTPAIRSSIPGDPNVPVDAVDLVFGPVNVFNSPANGSVTLELNFFNTDMDDVEEYFNIIAEDNTLLATSIATPAQCQNVVQIITTITSAQINQWGSDGFIGIRLEPNIPNGPPIFAINDVCNGSFVQATLSFDVDLQATLRTFLSVNQGPAQELNANQFPFDTLLMAGTHDISFSFLDCTDNVGICNQQVIITDGEAPSITCPIDATINLDQDTCQLSYALDTNFSVSDNCGFKLAYDSLIPALPASRFLDFSYNTILDTFLAANVLLSFEEVELIDFASGPAYLEVNLTGDINEPGESFEIFGEGGLLLGTTDLDPSQACGTSTTLFTINKADFNLWADDGQINITGVAPTSTAVPGGGINNCAPVVQDEDNFSMLTARLYYEDATVSYSVTGATAIPSTPLLVGDSISTEILNGGVNLINYQLADAEGNLQNCTYDITVLDTQDPEISCKNAVVFVHPSGLEDYNLLLSEIVDTSYDNCQIESFFFSPNVFDCTQVGNIINVNVSAFDAAGNSAECVSQVRVETPVLTPSFTAGICPGDTLQLFANVPDAGIPNAYTFSWTGPNNFTSAIEDPFIPNPTPDANGTYTLIVTGFNGCTSMGTIEVALQQLTVPELMADQNEICVQESLLLTATSYTGNVTYEWYEGIAPSGILLQTTTGPSILQSPTTGTHFYYVIIESPDCTTDASNIVQVEVSDPPPSNVNDPFITICEGDEIALGTDLFDPDYQYFWTGPNGYNETGQFPPVITNVSIADQGQYKLVIEEGACVSDTATSQVVIFNKPDLPQISGDNLFCEGTSMVLSVNNVTNADQYFWYLNQVLFTTTNNNSLFIANALTNLTGDWTVVTREGICNSDTSDIKEVVVDSELQIGSSNNGPVCEGDSVTLAVSFIPTASYVWESPSGMIFNEQEPKVLAEPGAYSVTVSTPAGCESVTTTNVVIDNLPVITALSNNSLNCMDGTVDVDFFPTVIPSGNFIYSWSGPNNYMSDQLNPTLENANSSDNGIYTLQVINGQCSSELSTTEINITDVPATPQISSVVGGCAGDTLSLFTDLVPSALYYWETPLGISTTTDSVFQIPNSANVNSGMYILFVEIDGCPSLASDTVEVIISPQPALPTIISNSPVCEGTPLELSTDAPANLSYFWEGPNGYISSSIDSIIASATLENAGTYTLSVANNSCFSEVGSVDVVVEARPDQPSLSASSYSFCSGSTLDICADLSTIAAGAELNFYVNGSLYSSGSETCIALTGTDLNLAGANEIYLITNIGSCLSVSSDTSAIIIEQIPSEQASILQSDQTLCDLQELDLNAVHDLPILLYQWSSSTSGIGFNPDTGVSTTVQNLGAGESVVYLSYSTAACADYSQDSILINNFSAPEAIDDMLELPGNEVASIDLIDNDIYLDAINISIISGPSSGSYEIENSFLTYTADPVFSGETTIEYEICYVNCPDLCSIATLVINVTLTGDCIVPTIITPNDDQINDALIIPCFTSGLYPNNTLTVFNQWGDQVYHEEAYQNDWKGTYQGNDLPTGTYFIVADRGDGSEPLNTFLMIQR